MIYIHQQFNRHLWVNLQEELTPFNGLFLVKKNETKFQYFSPAFIHALLQQQMMIMMMMMMAATMMTTMIMIIIAH